MRHSEKLTTADMLRLFDLLNTELSAIDTHAEVYLVGGAVMCLALGARDATRDVDAWFRPSTTVRQAAARVAAIADVPPSWLNDAVKAFLSPRGEFDPWLERSHLQVFVAQPGYMLALKCMAMRLGEEFQDLDDIRYLLRHLNITTAADALAIVTQYFDEAQVPVKTRLALEELLPAYG
jgi:predicted nucleotidyltransferase